MDMLCDTHPIRVIAVRDCGDHVEVDNIYAIAGNRTDWKEWYGTIRACNPGCRLDIDRTQRWMGETTEHPVCKREDWY